VVYLDWAATAPPDPEALDEARAAATDQYANPSSPHAAGRGAESFLQVQRHRLAACIGADPSEIIFTSGGTESNNIVLWSALNSGSAATVVISGIEHDSVWQPARGLSARGVGVRIVAAGASGRVDPDRLAEALDESTRLVSVMLVSNETGAVQPVAEIAAAVRERARRLGRRILLHTDAVQALGKLPPSVVDMRTLGVDSASFSSHKIRGPRGVGALWLRRGTRLEPVYTGGGQESGMRPGTENLPGVTGFAAAAERHGDAPDARERAGRLMSRLLDELASVEGVEPIPRDRVTAPPGSFSPFILKITAPPVPGEVLVRALGDRGVLVSTGSACSSRKRDRNRVLEAMGVDRERAFSSVRISIGCATTEGDIDALLEALHAELPALLRVARG